MIRSLTDLTLHLIEWLLVFGVGLRLLELHPELVIMLTGVAVCVVLRRVLGT